MSEPIEHDRTARRVRMIYLWRDSAMGPHARRRRPLSIVWIVWDHGSRYFFKTSIDHKV